MNRFPFSGTVYGENALRRIRRDFEVIAEDLSGKDFSADPEPFEATEVIFGTWGLPRLTGELLDKLPRLRAVFHAAGAWESLFTEEAQDLGIQFSNTIDLNSDYVARQTSACVILGFKGFFRAREQLRRNRNWEEAEAKAQGIYQAKLGLAGFGRIGRKVAGQLRNDGISIDVYDPGVSDSTLGNFESKRAGDLASLFSGNNVVSLHLPGTPATDRMISRTVLDRLPPGATLINTSRGSVIDEPALVEFLRVRDDVTAILDVCASEPIDPSSPLLELSNCFLTPHLSGAIGSEREHLGDAMVEESRRWLRGEPLRMQVVRSLHAARA